MDDQEIRITLRLPFSLRDRLSEGATNASRSMNGEIVERLENSFQWSAIQGKTIKERDEQKERADQYELDVRRLEMEKAAVEKELYDHQVTMTKQHHLILEQSDIIKTQAKISNERAGHIDALRRLADAKEQTVDLLLKLYFTFYEKYKKGLITGGEAMEILGRGIEESFRDSMKKKADTSSESEG